MSIALRAATNISTRSPKVYTLLIVLIILLSPFTAFCQKEVVNWFLTPSASLTFKSGGPQEIAQNQVETARVKSIISDSEGNMLFYTNGVQVWDRTHQVMPNGNELKGTTNSVCLIIPKPGDPNRYFIFTTMGTDWGAAPFAPAYYSEVDLCLNRGFGDVVEATKDTPLVSIAARRVAAVKHSNGRDYWVAFHKWESNAFYCYLITADGINPVPVISKTGPSLSLSSNSSGDGGEMKFSPDGKKLAMAISQYATAEVFDFDAQTGVLSNPLHIPALYRNGTLYTPDYTRGIEFSPDGQMLYLSRTNHTFLMQYDLSAGDDTSILKSKTIIAGDTIPHHTAQTRFSGMQLGPDGKLYIVRNSTGISVVSKPNEKGPACQYQDEIFSWEEGIDSDYFYSFPSFVSSYFNPTAVIKYDFSCLSPTIPFSLSYTNAKSDEDIAEIHWNFDDTASGASNVSQEINPSHTFLSTGTRTIRATIQWNDGSRQELSSLINIPSDIANENQFGLGNDTTLCPGQTIRLTAGYTGGDLVWQDGSSLAYLDVSSPGIYWARICKAGCSVTDSVTVSMEELSDFLGKDTLLCEKQELILDMEAVGEVLGWQDNSTSSTYTITKSGTYWVNILKNNCVYTDSVEVTFCDKPVFIPNVITPNRDGLNDRFVISGGNERDSWSLSILNRYGKEVYHTTLYQNDWDGANFLNGTYYYHLQHNYTGKLYRGWVRIIR